MIMIYSQIGSKLKASGVRGTPIRPLLINFAEFRSPEFGFGVRLAPFGSRLTPRCFFRCSIFDATCVCGSFWPCGSWALSGFVHTADLLRRRPLVKPHRSIRAPHICMMRVPLPEANQPSPDFFVHP